MNRIFSLPPNGEGGASLGEEKPRLTGPALSLIMPGIVRFIIKSKNGAIAMHSILSIFSKC
jgi:hypothetical protein